MRNNFAWLSTLALISLSAFASSGKKPAEVPEHFENPAYDVAKIPIADEPEVNMQYAQEEWDALNAVAPPSCEGQSVWKLVGRPEIAGTAIKEKNAPVQGRFERVQAYLLGQAKGPVNKGMGYLDLSSWNSGNVPRDRRVQRYIFGVEDKSASVLPFTFSLADWKDKGSWKTTLKLEFQLLGETRILSFPVEAKLNKDNVSIKTLDKARVTYGTPDTVERIMQLLERCNHQFLASYADVTLNITFKKTC